MLSPTSVHLTWVAPCHTQQYHIYYRGICGAYVDKGRLDTDCQEHTVDELQEGVNYSFTVNQTGFSEGRVLSTGPVYARTFPAGMMIASHINSVMSATILLFHRTNFIMWCFDCYLTILTMPDQYVLFTCTCRSSAVACSLSNELFCRKCLLE